MNVDALRQIVRDAVAIWLAGGWGMVALAFNGLVMYALGTVILLKLWSKGLGVSPERAWRAWHEGRKGRGRGVMGRLLAGAMTCRRLDELVRYFDTVRNEEVLPFERDLRVMQVSVSTAPLLGLLGTVMGMLSTFHALATGGGGDKTMGMVAGGISEALITTETGLVLALSGMIFQFSLTRQHEGFGKRIAHLETLCMQYLQGGEAEGGAGATDGARTTARTGSEA